MIIEISDWRSILRQVYTCLGDTSLERYLANKMRLTRPCAGTCVAYAYPLNIVFDAIRRKHVFLARRQKTTLTWF